MKQKFIYKYMQIACSIGELSSAKRLQVGCVVVDEETHEPISWGYNGTPEGWDNVCEDENNKTKPEVRHAEHNTISKITKSTRSSENSVMFLSHAPCIACATWIESCGIKKVYYQQKYGTDEGLIYLTKAGIEVIKLYREYPA